MIYFLDIQLLRIIILKKKHLDCFRGSIMTHLREFVSSVLEYRRTSRGNFKHKLEDILMLVILGDAQQVYYQGWHTSIWQTSLETPAGERAIPVWITFRSYALPCVSKHRRRKDGWTNVCFCRVFRKETPASATDIICIDGKAMRGTLYQNGRNPDIVSAYSLRSGFTLATDVCKEKSNEIKSVPRLLDKLDVLGCVVTADAMSFQKVIIDKIRDKGADFVIELKANQSSLRYGLEDSIKTATPTDIYKESPCLEHGRIESRVCCIYCGEELIADREEWNGNLTVIEILTSTEKKSDGRSTSEQRLYISSLDSSAGRLSQITKQYWAIESMHWDLDRNLRQDSIKRKAERSARNPDTIQGWCWHWLQFGRTEGKNIR